MPKKSGPSIGALFILNRLSVIGYRLSVFEIKLALFLKYAKYRQFFELPILFGKSLNFSNFSPKR